MWRWHGFSWGVTGGIAAYKACELVRLFVRGGHEVVPLVTEGADRFVRRETFFALARREPRGRPLCASDPGRPVRDRAADREHAGEARPWGGRQPRDGGSARAPRAVRRRAGDEPAHVGAPGDEGERGTAAGARSRARRSGRGETAEGELGVGRMAEPEEIHAFCEALLEKREQLRGVRVLVTAGARASRSTTCASSAIAPRGGWVSRWPRKRAGAART